MRIAPGSAVQRYVTASPPAPQASVPLDPQNKGKGIRIGTGISVAVFTVLLAAVAGLMFASRIDDNLYALAPVQIVLGSCAFLAVITVIVIVFARLGLYDRSRALGLPSGSVRALIALILLIIFVIFANVIYGSLSAGGSSRAFAGLTAEQVEDLPGAVLEQRAGPAEDTFDGRVLFDAADEAVALGQQIVTALITLVAAISAFYFGTSSLESAARTLGTPGTPGGPGNLLVLHPGSPAGLAPSTAGGYEPVTIKLGGTALEEGGAAHASVTGDQDGTVLASPSESGVFVYTPVRPAGLVTITFTSSGAAGATATATLLATLAEPVQEAPIGAAPGGDVGATDPPAPGAGEAGTPREDP